MAASLLVSTATTNQLAFLSIQAAFRRSYMHTKVSYYDLITFINKIQGIYRHIVSIRSSGFYEVCVGKPRQGRFQSVRGLLVFGGKEVLKSDPS